jgi:N-acetyl-anhydromuramyl-L-alanine amidase AmpD
MIPAEAYPQPSVLVDRRAHTLVSHRHGGRSWRKITGICLHQTACVLGERDARWDTVGAHIGITRSGRVLWLHDLDVVVWHGNAWNAQTVGIEIDGLYEGVLGRPSTLWDDPDTAGREQPTPLTDASAVAAQETIRWLCSVVAQHGGDIKALVAHRQASKSRRNDPGSDIWQRVALPLHAELGLTDGGAGFEIGGYPVPVEWDPSRKGWGY